MGEGGGTFTEWKWLYMKIVFKRSSQIYANDRSFASRFIEISLFSFRRYTSPFNDESIELWEWKRERGDSLLRRGEFANFFRVPSREKFVEKTSPKRLLQFR